MPLHLIKLCVGADSLQDLRDAIGRRDDGESAHQYTKIAVVNSKVQVLNAEAHASDQGASTMEVRSTLERVRAFDNMWTCEKCGSRCWKEGGVRCMSGPDAALREILFPADALNPNGNPCVSLRHATESTGRLLGRE